MPTKRVLVIDDEADIRAIIQGCLEEIAGWEVLSAASGTEGIQIAAAEQPDAILLDVSMPQMNGLEAFSKLKTHPQTQTIPVAFLTAKALPDEQIHFSRLAIAGVILKPFDPMTLVEQIARLFSWDI